MLHALGVLVAHGIGGDLGHGAAGVDLAVLGHHVVDGKIRSVGGGHGQLGQHLDDGDLLAAFLAQIQSGLAADLAAADDDNPFAQLVGMAEALLGGDDVGIFGAGDGDDDGIGADSGEHHVEVLLLDHLGSGLTVQDHFDAQLFHHVQTLLQEAVQVVLEGGVLGKDDFAAQMVGLLVQGDVMPALSGVNGACHAGRAAADDTDALGSGVLGDELVEYVFAADGGIGGAAELHLHVVAQAEEALQAGSDLLLAAVAGLVNAIGVGDSAAGHGDNVGSAGGESLLNELGLLEGADGEDGLGEAGFLDLAGVLGVDAGGIELNRVHNGLGDVVLNGAAGDVGQVDLVLNELEEVDAVLYLAAAFHQLVAGDADLDGHTGADGGADAVDYHDREAAAVLCGAAVSVGALIILGGEEVGNEGAVAEVEQDHIEADLDGALGGLGVVVGHLVHLILGEHGIGLAGLLVGLSVGGIHDQIAVGIQTVATEGKQLEGDLGAEEVYGAGETVPVVVVLLVIDVGVGVDGVGLVQQDPVDVLAGEGDAGGAASGLFAVVGDDGLSGIRLAGSQQMNAGRRGPYTVFEYHAGLAQGDGAENMGVSLFHADSFLYMLYLIIPRM